jgi:hypothetical protein
MHSAILRIAVHIATKEASFVQYFSGRILLSFAISQPRRFWGMGPEEFKTNQIEKAPSGSRKYIAWPSRT